MTENKRFTMCHEQNDINGWTMSIIDWETKEPFNYTTYEVHSNSITDTRDEMEDLCLLLNELNDENKKLKIFLKAVNEELDLANRDYDTLEEENNQLKQQLKSMEDSFKFSCTENHIEFNKDKLKVEDTHTELTLKDGKLCISVFIPQLNDYVKFFYLVTGRKMEREFINYDGDV